MLVLAISSVALLVFNLRGFSKRKMAVLFLWIFGVTIASIRSHNVFDTAFFVFWPINFALLFSNDFRNISARSIHATVILSFLAYASVELNLVVVNRQLSIANINANGLSYACLSLFAFHYYFLVSDTCRGYKDKILNIIAALLYVLIILKMGSRMAALIVVLLFLVFLYKTYLRRGNLLRNVVWLSAVLVVSSLFISKSNIGQTFMSERFFLGNSTISVLEDRSILERLDMYQTLINNKMIWIVSMKDYQPYPHNLFVELIMRLGILGVFLVFFVIKQFKNAFLSLLGPSPGLFAICFVVASLQAMSSLSLEMNRALFLGLAYVSNKRIS